MSPEKKFRVVNQTLGTQPKIGPFPADQIFPWLVIGIGCIFVVYYFLNLGWLATIIATFWGWATWWFVSTNKSFMGKFVGTPRITRGYMHFMSALNPLKENSQKRRRSKIRKPRS